MNPKQGETQFKKSAGEKLFFIVSLKKYSVGFPGKAQKVPIEVENSFSKAMRFGFV